MLSRTPDLSAGLLAMLLTYGCVVGSKGLEPAGPQNPGRLIRAVLSVGLCERAGIGTGAMVDACPPEHAIPLRRVINIVSDARLRQVGNAGSTFLRQIGVYQHRTGVAVLEESVSVSVWQSPGESAEAFRTHILDLGQTLRQELNQEAAVVEFQAVDDMFWMSKEAPENRLSGVSPRRATR